MDAHTTQKDKGQGVCDPWQRLYSCAAAGSELTVVVMLLLQAVKKTATEYTSQGEGRRAEGQVWAAWQDMELLLLKDKRNSSVSGCKRFTSPDRKMIVWYSEFIFNTSSL